MKNWNEKLEKITNQSITTPIIYCGGIRNAKDAELVIKICGGEASKFIITGKPFPSNKILKFEIFTIFFWINKFSYTSLNSSKNF